MVRRLLFERIQEEVVRLRLTLPLPFSHVRVSRGADL
jgi:hypothetical protein